MLLYLAVFACSCALVLPAFRISLLTLLTSSNFHSDLDFSPNDLHIRQIALSMFVLCTKALQKTLRLAPKLRLNQSSKSLDTAYTLPALRLRTPVIVRPRDAIQYEAALDVKPLDERTHRNYNIFFLAGLTTPLMMLLLAKRSCPVFPLGCVNVRNRFEFLRPRLCHDAAQGLLKGLGAEARLLIPARRVKRGIEFDVVIEVTTGKVDLVKDQIIFRQIITLLQFLPQQAKPVFVESKPSQGGMVLSSTEDTSTYDAIDRKLDIDSAALQRWAVFSKDYNPIHISSWAARAFGFHNKIAHGNLVVGRTLPLLADIVGPQFSNMWSPNSRPSWLEVEFKRPMVVPVDFEILIDERDERNVVTSLFKIVRESKTYVNGEAGWI